MWLNGTHAQEVCTILCKLYRLHKRTETLHTVQPYPHHSRNKAYQVSSSRAAHEPGPCTQEEHADGVEELQCRGHDQKQCQALKITRDRGWLVGGHVPEGGHPAGCHCYSHRLHIYRTALQAEQVFSNNNIVMNNSFTSNTVCAFDLDHSRALWFALHSGYALYS